MTATPIHAGDKYGNLTVLVSSTRSKQPIECRCDCGKVCSPMGDRLRRGETVSCGCLRNQATGERRRKLTTVAAGQVFDRLTVTGVDYVDAAKGKEAVIVCRCSCGNTVRTHQRVLLGGKSRSCGCLRRELLNGESNHKWNGGAEAHRRRKNDIRRDRYWNDPEYREAAKMLSSSYNLLRMGI